MSLFFSLNMPTGTAPQVQNTANWFHYTKHNAVVKVPFSSEQSSSPALFHLQHHPLLASASEGNLSVSKMAYYNSKAVTGLYLFNIGNKLYFTRANLKVCHSMMPLYFYSWSSDMLANSQISCLSRIA